jgi:hypothetical protein
MGPFSPIQRVTRTRHNVMLCQQLFDLSKQAPGFDLKVNAEPWQPEGERRIEFPFAKEKSGRNQGNDLSQLRDRLAAEYRLERLALPRTL